MEGDDNVSQDATHGGDRLFEKLPRLEFQYPKLARITSQSGTQLAKVVSCVASALECASYS